MKKTILAIGSTGLGKTTMARLLCEVDVEGSSGTKSATMKAIMYETNEFLFIDTRGFDDSSDTKDEEVFHDIMCLFQRYGKNNIFKIDAILWFCCESERELAHLQREARFIQQLIEYTDECKPKDLWNSVLIITKGNFSSHKLIDGPISAAKNACQAEESFIVKYFPCWIYDIIDPPKSRWVRMDSETRSEFNCYSKNEIKSKIQNLISNFNPISVHFRERKCEKCDATGDPRLFSAKCHTTSIFKHSIEIEYFHSKPIVHFHSGSKLLDHEPDEITIKNFFFKMMLGSNPTELPASQVSSETAKEIIKSYESGNQIQATLKSQPFHMLPKIKEVLSVGIVSAIVALHRNKSHAMGLRSDLASGSKDGITSKPNSHDNCTSNSTLHALYYLGTAIVVLAISYGGTVYYYETKNIPCKRCKKLIGEKGCIEKCENCKKEWIENGCTIGYDCCKHKEEAPGCQAREKCTMCPEAAIKLISQGCTRYCAKCKEEWEKTPGCDPSFNHDPVIMN